MSREKTKEASVRATWLDRAGSAPDVFDGGSLQRVHLQHEHEQRGHRASQVLWDVEDAPSDLLKQRGDVFVIKGQSATQQGVQDHPTAPDVHFWACIEPDRLIRSFDTLQKDQVNNCHSYRSIFQTVNHHLFIYFNVSLGIFCFCFIMDMRGLPFKLCHGVNFCLLDDLYQTA